MGRLRWRELLLSHHSNSGQLWNCINLFLMRICSNQTRKRSILWSLSLFYTIRSSRRLKTNRSLRYLISNLSIWSFSRKKKKRNPPQMASHLRILTMVQTPSERQRFRHLWMPLLRKTCKILKKILEFAKSKTKVTTTRKLEKWWFRWSYGYFFVGRLEKWSLRNDHQRWIRKYY